VAGATEMPAGAVGGVIIGSEQPEHPLVTPLCGTPVRGLMTKVCSCLGYEYRSPLMALMNLVSRVVMFFLC